MVRMEITDFPRFIVKWTETKRKKLQYYERAVEEIKKQIREKPEVGDDALNGQIQNIIRTMQNEMKATSLGQFESMATRIGVGGSRLLPMTQIYATGAFGQENIQHHGVYIGYNVVLEVAAETCTSVVRGATSVADNLRQCLGVSMLSKFGAHHASSDGRRTIYTLNPRLRQYAGFDEKKYIETAFERYLQLLEKNKGGWRYNLFTHNCQHAANFVVTGKDEMQQQLPRPQELLAWLKGCDTPSQEPGGRVVGTIQIS